MRARTRGARPRGRPAGGALPGSGSAARGRRPARRRGAPGPTFPLALAGALAGACGGATGAGSSEAPSAAEPAPAPPPADFADALDRERMWRDLERIVGFGARVAGSSRIEKLRRFLEAELAAAGLTPEREAFTETTPIGPIEFCNVRADLAGASSGPDGPPIVVLATHFDTKRLEFDFPGANDSGSGTALLLELARYLAAEDEPRPVTYRFLFLDGEEAIRPFWQDPDNCYGSRHHARRLVETGELSRVGAAVVLDMVGDTDLRLFTDNYSHPELLEIFFDAGRRIGLGRHVGGPREWIRDDHLSFLAVGIPSVDLIDFEYGPGNAYWHTQDDRLEHCSPESLEATGRIVLAGLPALERFVD